MRIKDTVYNYISDCSEYDEEHNINNSYNKEELRSTIAKHIRCCKGSDVHAYSYYNNNKVDTVVIECNKCKDILTKHK